MDVLGIPGMVVVQGGAVAVLLVVVLAIVSGRLVPRKVLEDVRADRDARLADRDALIKASEARGDEWRAAYQAENERNDVQARQLTELLDGTRTTNALIEGMKKASQERRR